MPRLPRILLLATATFVLIGGSGCAWAPKLASDFRGRPFGQTFYVGGAGPVGQVVGTFDVPKGLRNAGYRGAIEVFAWQTSVGGTIRDQVDRGRNLTQSRRLARRIRKYLDEHPDRPVNLIALSAGTGIAAWALESLPASYKVQNVVFLSSSLSRGYDLTRALEHVNGHLYAFHSPNDRVLRYMVPIAGSVDRNFGRGTAAGLYGFRLPALAGPEARRIYRARLRNRAYCPRYRLYGYDGHHHDCTARAFVSRILAPLLMEETPVPAYEPDQWLAADLQPAQHATTADQPPDGAFDAVPDWDIVTEQSDETPPAAPR